jgi:hypothetical protein
MFKTKRLIALFAGIFLLALNVSAVFAAAPEPIHIEVEEFPGSGIPEPFTASGAAVDSGLFCASGLVEDAENSSNDSDGPYRIIWSLKRFHCGDGTIDLRMVVQLDLTTLDTTARWRIVGGTGAYEGLKGHGSLVGISNNPDPGILDIYDGVLH